MEIYGILWRSMEIFTQIEIYEEIIREIIRDIRNFFDFVEDFGSKFPTASLAALEMSEDGDCV